MGDFQSICVPPMGRRSKLKLPCLCSARNCKLAVPLDLAFSAMPIPLSVTATTTSPPSTVISTLAIVLRACFAMLVRPSRTQAATSSAKLPVMVESMGPERARLGVKPSASLTSLMISITRDRSPVVVPPGEP